METLNPTLSGWSTRYTVNKVTEDLNITTDQSDLTDIYTDKQNIDIFIKGTWNILHDSPYGRP